MEERRYTIYDYIDYTDGVYAPSCENIVPTRVNPKKDLVIRPYEEVFLHENGDVPKIIYWDSPDKNTPLMVEEITYVRDKDGNKTKGMAITQTKTLKWYYYTENGDVLLDDVNTKILLKDYSKGAVKDSMGDFIPTAEQVAEWKRKSQNVISYMLTKEVAGTPIDQAVFKLFDNIMLPIQKWQNNPTSKAFFDAIDNKDGGFDLPLAPNVTLNIWDVDVSTVPPKVITLQQFLKGRIESIYQ